MVKWLDKLKQLLYNLGMFKEISKENVQEVSKQVEQVRRERDEEIYMLYTQTKDLPKPYRMTVEKLADKYGVSKQRISQIIAKEEEKHK